MATPGLSQSFADEVAASLPSGMMLPTEFRSALEWCEQAGSVNTYGNTGKRYAFLFPGQWQDWHKGLTLVTFQLCDREMVMHWTRGDEPAADRLAPIIRTGGDGSYAALWLDDAGRQHIVHMGSGSGSTMLGVLTSSPLDMLRLMAIGYEELCWPDAFDEPPAVTFERTCDCADEGVFEPPAQFRAFIETTFAANIPTRGSEIVKQRVADMGDEASGDPFWRWIRAFDR